MNRQRLLRIAVVLVTGCIGMAAYSFFVAVQHAAI